jgi:hypothetical protein
MSKGVYDIFAFIINILGNDWHPKYIILGLLEPIKTIWQALVQNLTNLLDKYSLRKNILVYVKDESSNFNAMTEWKHTKGEPFFFKLFFRQCDI